MSNSPCVDFTLPGWVNTPISRHACLLSLASAYSRKWNPRNLEHPWYEPWAQILQALVADLPSLAVAPQSYLWYFRHPKPGDHRIEPPSLQVVNEWFEEADTTIDSIHVGDRRNKYQLADFSITRKVSQNRPPPVCTPDDKLYLSREVEYMGIPVLCELKRGAPRTSNFRTSLARASGQLSVASDQLVRQSHHLFQMYPHQEEVLLIAVAGFWWSYRVLQRSESKIATVEEVEEAEHEEANTEPDQLEADAQLGGAVDMVVGPDLARDEQDPSGLPAFYHGLDNITFRDQISNEEVLHLHLLMTQVDFRLDTTNTWSPPLLFGTSPSNQVLYLIHQRLETIINDTYNGSKG